MIWKSEPLTKLFDVELQQAPQIYTSKIDVSYASDSPNI